jgi:hypothetical protein
MCGLSREGQVFATEASLEHHAHDVVEAVRSIPASHDQTSTPLREAIMSSTCPSHDLFRVLDLGEQIALCCSRA